MLYKHADLDIADFGAHVELELLGVYETFMRPYASAECTPESLQRHVTAFLKDYFSREPPIERATFTYRFGTTVIDKALAKAVCF